LNWIEFSHEFALALFGNVFFRIESVRVCLVVEQWKSQRRDRDEHLTVMTVMTEVKSGDSDGLMALVTVENEKLVLQCPKLRHHHHHHHTLPPPTHTSHSLPPTQVCRAFE
jgi:hypothetical protein